MYEWQICECIHRFRDEEGMIAVKVGDNSEEMCSAGCHLMNIFIDDLINDVHVCIIFLILTKVVFNNTLI